MTVAPSTARAVLALVPGLLLVSQLAIAQQFTEQSATRFPSPAALEYSNQVAIADIDGDLDLDIAFANGCCFNSAGAPQTLRIYVNDGNGVFADESGPRTGGLTARARDVEFGDIDGDGDLDMVVAQDFSNPPYLFVNDGNGFFSDESGTRLPPVNLGSPHVAFGDVDNDGDLDLWFANGGSSRFGSGQAQLWINDGAGFYSNGTATLLPQQNIPQPSDCIFGDVDGDLDLDMMEGHLGSSNSKLYLNAGDGSFVQAAFPSDSSCYSYDFGDLDGDGDLDLFGANGFPGNNRDIFCGNDGAGVFSNITNAILPQTQNPNVDDNDSKFIDYDMDGDLDVVIARIGGAERVLRNQGGSYVIANSIIQGVNDSTLDVEVGDLDNDGRIDIVTAQGESGNFTNRVYMNSGPIDDQAPTFPQVEVLADTEDSVGPYVVRAVARDDMTGDNGFHRQSATMTFTVDGGVPQEVELTHSGHDVFRAEIPGQAPGSLIEYQFHAVDWAGNEGSSATTSFTILLPPPSLLRGDANNDGAVDALTDALFLLAYGFTPGSPAPACDDAADVNDDGELMVLIDGIYLLSFGFIPGSPPPPAPYPDCDIDASDDALGCAATACP